MSYELLAILLLVVGCGLIVAEVFLPSGGMILVLCILSFVAAIWCAYAAWWDSSPTWFWSYIAAALVLIPTVVIGVFRLLSTSRVGDRILLAAPDASEVIPYQEEQERLSGFVGRQGKALTLLTPGGMVGVDGERLHAFTEGLMVQPGDPVEVVEVRGTRLLVRPAPNQPAASENIAAGDSGSTGSTDPPLDFDVPQG